MFRVENHVIKSGEHARELVKESSVPDHICPFPEPVTILSLTTTNNNNNQIFLRNTLALPWPKVLII